MNILFITQFLSTTKGGGEYLFSVMANALADRGHKVWIITHKIDDENYCHFHQNVKILFVSSIKYEGGLPSSFVDNLKFVIQSVIKGIRLVRNEKIDIIHSNNFSPALSASILSSITGRQHITSMWDIFSLCGKNYWNRWANQKGISKLYAMVGPMFEKLILYMRHTAIHTVSEASREDLIKYGAKKTIFVIPPAIELTECQKITPKNSQFVYVGRLVFYKNLETIIRAISIIRKSDTEIVLKIIGGGPHKENLEKITRELGLEKNIEFCGYVSEDEKYRIISSSISMVFPSLCEGFGLVILESFLCSRPIIVSNIRPMSDIINDKKEGLVVDATDEEKWAEAMKHIISDTNNALEMGAEGKRKLEEKYRLDSMISKIEEMYYKVVH